MIGGFPHRYEDSFFHHALEKLGQESKHHITSSLFTLGGFPITRIPKHFKSKCLDSNPDIVVLQFASCDLIVSIRGHRHSDRNVPIKPATALDQLKWLIHGMAGDAFRMKPATPPDVYLEIMGYLTRTLLENHIVPVVMSPFVFGGRRSDRIARDCSGRLQRALAAMPGTTFVDAYSALDRFPRPRMLLGDGSHLSIEGQRVVGDALLPCLKEVIDRRVQLPKRSAPTEMLAATRPVSSPRASLK